MRILTWPDTYWPVIGGIEVVARSVAEAMVRRGHEVLVLTNRIEGHDVVDEEVGGVQIHRLDAFAALRRRDPASLLHVLADARSAFQAFKPDVIHLQGIGPGAFLCMRLAPDRRCPAAVTCHHALTSQVNADDRIKAESIAWADAVVGVSRRVLDTFEGIFGSFGQRGRVIYNGIEAPRAEPRPLATDPPHAVFLGRLTGHKGVDDLLKATARVAERFPAMRLTIVGPGPQEPELRTLAGELGLSRRVRFAGRVEHDRVLEFLDEATVLVLPSRPWGEWEEGLQTVLLEAQAMARPVIASRNGGSPEALADGVSGLLFDPGDIEGLADRMVQLFSDPDRARQMGLAGRQRFLDHFQLERMNNDYEQLYQELVAAPASARQP